MTDRKRRSPHPMIERRDRLYRCWEELRLRYAPLRDGIWSYSSKSPLVGQGWKLHLSATILSAVDLLQACGEALANSRHQFKMIAELAELAQLNAGTVHGRSQIGKVVTIYCPHPQRGRALAEELHRLTKGIPCPEVPSDRRFRKSGCVFYRYGAYEKLEVEYKGERVPAYRDATGVLIPDRRAASTAVPDEVQNPFADASHVRSSSKPAEQARYKATSVIQWRGGGGVYHVLDKKADPPEHYILKTGIRHGDVDIEGLDGVMYRTREHQALVALRKSGVSVPRVIDFFKQGGNAHLVVQRIRGENLWKVADAGDIAPEHARRLAVQLADIVASIHAAGWVWRDCKLSNVIDDGHQVWAVDLESAFRVGGRARLTRYTPGYVLEKSVIQTTKAARAQDLYALGVTLHRIFTSTPDRPDTTLELKPLPDYLGLEIRECIERLCDKDPAKRPSAAEAKELLAWEFPSQPANDETCNTVQFAADQS